MDYYLSKRWRLKFRRDPDTGRVLFIGPLVVSLDVTRRPGSKALRMCWTCCDACHSEHANRMVARLHWLWLRTTRKA